MKQSFTLNQCVRLIYGETSPGESDMLREVIRHNDTLKEEFSKMQSAYDALCGTALNPRRATVEAILNFNRNSACLAR